MSTTTDQKTSVVRSASREKGIAVVLALAGSAVVLAVAGRTWAKGTADVHGARLAVEATGNAVGSAPTGLALLGLAGALAVFATRRTGRVIVGAIIAAAGAGVAVTSLMALGDTSAVDAEASAKAAVEGVKALGVTHTAWPYVAALGGLLMLVAGLIVVVRGRRWAGLSSRYEAPAAQRKGGQTPADLWNSLDRGEDPTR
jgi:uncharacterized membrane protein (TIGR02234 family)